MSRRVPCAALAILGVMTFAKGVAAQCPDNIPHVTGTWTTLPYQMPINPISATVMHTGKVLIIAGSENDANNYAPGADSYRAAVWDPTGTDQSAVSVQHIEYDVFCSGSAQLPHGRIMVIGGTSDYSFKGEKRASIFDPLTEQFAQSQDMADGRWYGTATTLPDGRLMAFSGLTLTGSTNTNVQMYDLTNAGPGWGSTVTEPFTPPLFPRAYVLPSGKVFYTGQGAGTNTSRGYLFDPVARSWSNSANTTSNRQYGGSVLLPLYPPGYTPKVLNLGGGNPATKSTEIIDMSAGSPAWSPGPNMSAARIEMNAVLLPNGLVLASGGSTSNEVPDAAGKNADLYDPATNLMASAGTASYSRLYHSTAVLLPDATVASLGSNPGDRGKYLAAIEIYTPPYLYDANDHLITSARPAITSVSSGVVNYGGTFSVNYTSSAPISSAVLMRPGSTTHANDMDQRLVGLCGPSPQPACSGSAGSLTLTAPPNGNIAPPGYYMLFLLDTAGVPSKARFIEITPYATTPPHGAIATPATDPTITAGGTVSFTSGTTATKYSWVFPGGSPATSTAKNPGNVTFSSPGEYTVSLTLLDASNNSDANPPTRIVTVLPSSPDFEIDVVPPAGTVHPGGSTTYNVHVTPLSGFTGTVTLSVSTEAGFPAGVVSGGFSPPTITGSGDSTLTMNTSSSAVPYAVSLTVKGVSGSLSRQTSTTLIISLAPPDPLSALPSDSQVQLSWPPSTGASGYVVGRSLDSGGPYETVGCPTALTYTDTGLANGTTYRYVVNAQFVGGANAGGASAPTAEVAATPPCPIPGYSGSLSASKSSGNAVWSWTAGGATAWDLVRGDLATLRSSGGDFGAALDALPAGENACLANDTGGLSLADPYGAPPPGSGVFAIVRPVAIACPAAGTYDDGNPTQIGDRDTTIVVSSRSCP